ncbi:MAG: RNA polymerase sigma factor [Candidatus Latescibacterota bacterium]|nr:MAG: RNA polymerase sigma factor [Candidatus Latescibacterota bacterium]
MENKGFQTGEEAGLVAKALRGNEKAFRQLIAQYQPMAYSVVRGILGDREDVEDVLQDVFIKVYRGLSGFRGDSKLSTWIYRIARNEAVTAARKRDPSGPPVEELDLQTPARTRPDEQYLQKARQDYLGRCLGQLDENYRVVLELRYMGEMSYAEIGEAMDLPIGTVKTYIYRAKVELRKVMTRRGHAGDRKPE